VPAAANESKDAFAHTLRRTSTFCVAYEYSRMFIIVSDTQLHRLHVLYIKLNRLCCYKCRSDKGNIKRNFV